MHIRTLFFILSMLLFGLGCTMVLPLFTAWFYDESLRPLLSSAGILLGVGSLFGYIFRPQNEVTLSNKESIVIVASCWIMAGVAGALPYLLNGNFIFADALFESISGFTTTGASILSDIEALPKGILMWRALTHWLGGMGIIVLTLAILPMLGMGGMQLYKAEVTGPQVDKLMPRIHDTALYLWIVYFLFTVVQFILLMFGGMSWFDSLAHTFATVATGGFSTQNASVTNYSPYIQWVITIFMFLAGVNFTLHYKLLFSGKIQAFTKNTEFKIYLYITVICSLITAAYLYFMNTESGVEYAIRTAFFQIVSICTSTGFATADYEVWPLITQSLILFVMIMGACAGSTGGGIKVMRFALLQKITKKELQRILHPRVVNDIKLDSKSVSSDILNGVTAFIIIYLVLIFIGGLFITAFGYDFTTSYSASISAFSNTGPGFGLIGPTENFGFFEPAIKYMLCILMLIGRLEIFTIFLLFLPSFWRS